MIEKKIVRSYQGFNSKLYNPKADLGEKNSGEVKVDTTGYVSLEDLLQRCGVSQHLNMNPDFEVVEGLDKFSDNIDIVQDFINRTNAAEEKAVKQFLDKKNSAKTSESQPQMDISNGKTEEK